MFKFQCVVILYCERVVLIKMYCSPAEIEEKRRQARQKLAQKTSPLKNPQTSFGCTGNSSPVINLKHNVFPFKTSVHNKKPYEKAEVWNQNKNSEKYLGKTTTEFYGKEKPVTAKFSLQSSEKFIVDLCGFSAQVIDVFKTVPSRNYDPKTRIWSFHFKDYDLVLSKLQNLQPNVLIEKLPNFVVNCLKETTYNIEINFNRLDPDLANTLLPFQLEGLSFGISKKGRCLIADDMGLGKTFQALAIANYYRDDWPLLIVTTASMRNVWEETITKYLPSVSIMHIQYMTSGRDYIGDAKILITSHDLMSRCKDKLLERGFGAIIIDESHVVKNFKTQVTKAATELAKKSKRIVLLSGTPALSRPSELFCQLKLLDEKFFGTFYDYSKRYCDAKQTNFGWDATGKSNLKELEIVLGRKFMIRRIKDDVLKSLPKKMQEVVELDVHLEQFPEQDRKCLEGLARQYKTLKKSQDKHALLLTFFCETARIKIPSVCSYVLQILESKQKFLVFAHHKIMLNAVEEVVKRKNISYIRIDGNTTSEQRKYFVDKFQLDDNYKCAVLSITAANAGLTLTAARLVLFAELHWNPSILSQAEARAHRIGQEHAVVIRYLIAKGTADDSIWPMLQEKQKILNEVGLGKTTLEGATVVKQDSSVGEIVTEGLNLSTFLTAANTLDITTYFKSEKSCDNSFAETTDVFDDGLDDILCNMDI